MKKITPLSFALFFFVINVFSQKVSTTKISELVSQFKSDLRGPYKDIRWFCTDGSIRQPKDPCPDSIGPGAQHARYKDAVVALGKSNNIYLGQILTYTTKEEFWDEKYNHSRLKQYQLDAYLRSVDNGWINRKSQFYRGAIQSEDEQLWGNNFYNWLLSSDKAIEENFFVIRQSLKDVPYGSNENLSQLIRSQSKVISDEFPQFMDLRVKIHSNPEFKDINSVIAFKAKYNSELSKGNLSKLDLLISTMSKLYQPLDISALLKKTTLLKNTDIGRKIETYSFNHRDNTSASNLISDTAELLLDIRTAILEVKSPMARLQLLDLSLKLEAILFKTSPQWQPENIQEMLTKICYLGMAAAGSGYIELQEWDQLDLKTPLESDRSMTLGELTLVMENARRLLEWSTSMVKANYQDLINEYTAFEPKSYGFIDDKIRGSLILYLGQSVGDLGSFIAKESALTNKVMDLENLSTLRGLNPGYAFGELVVVPGSPEAVEVASNKIYIFEYPPSNLKPIAGIATVSDGNMVSHVQLLARNLGIPNAILSDDNLNSLLKYNGQKVFYAVSNHGNIILKPEQEMTSQEIALVKKTERKNDKIEVPIMSIRLDETNVLNLRTVDANDSGQLCGPKAANLGQLKKMFPENVVEGLVIPFGIFKEHMNQQMPNQQISYWTFLTQMFDAADKMRNQNIDESEIENYQLNQLEILRNAIIKMPLKPSFISQLESQFNNVLGKPLGEIPVFLRSDTNMEDLKDFTGAGLNLTLFNVVDKASIIDGIKAVWASPYTERSFKWRQKYLLNPENVFPSILVIPSVDVDYSGVLITKGLQNENNSDLTIAFSRGAGGAVDGQSAETYLIYNSGGSKLLAPAREPFYIRLPVSGGTEKKIATFNQPILNVENINTIRTFAHSIRNTLSNETQSDYKGAYDVELGFKDHKMWLFQIRPFVENKSALSSDYLESITPKINKSKEVILSQKL